MLEEQKKLYKIVKSSPFGIHPKGEVAANIRKNLYQLYFISPYKVVRELQ